jgi:hypothetical protein
MGANCSVPASEPFSSTAPTTFSVSVTTTSRAVGALHPPIFSPVPWLWTLAIATLGIVVRLRNPRTQSSRRTTALSLARAVDAYVIPGLLWRWHYRRSAAEPERNPGRDLHADCERDFELHD